MEISLRELGTAMLHLAPLRSFRTWISPWFFLARFKFLSKFRSEEAARFAAWRSLENFLPLLGYVSLGFFLMAYWEAKLEEQGLPPPLWRGMVLEKTRNTGNVDATILDTVYPLLADWNQERVGALYRVPRPDDFCPSADVELRRELHAFLSILFNSSFHIPLYLFWGENMAIHRPEFDKDLVYLPDSIIFPFHSFHPL